MDHSIFINCLIIIVARIADVTLGTLRTASIVQGRRAIAFMLGFVEMLIWVSVVLRIISHLHSPIYIVSYAIGFGIGNFLGVTVEGWLSFGQQVLRIFTRRLDMADALRKAGYVVTEFMGKGRDGAVFLLYLQIPRKMTREITGLVRKMDPESFYVVDDVRMIAQPGGGGNFYPTGWRSVAKKK
ncbi:DUF5698 domain-containing protein [Omnitrophica bacterium]|nr:DUF5698 domain-containing protein [Candidatus Omnitrophota bacterium]